MATDWQSILISYNVSFSAGVETNLYTSLPQRHMKPLTGRASLYPTMSHSQRGSKPTSNTSLPQRHMWPLTGRASLYPTMFHSQRGSKLTSTQAYHRDTYVATDWPSILISYNVSFSAGVETNLYTSLPQRHMWPLTGRASLYPTMSHSQRGSKPTSTQAYHRDTCGH